MIMMRKSALLLTLLGLLLACGGWAEVPPAPAGAFTIAVLPDTQNYSAGHPEIYETITKWIVDHREDQRIVFVSQTGDIVDHPAVEEEWINARRAMDALHGLIPYGFSVGNHDMQGATGQKLFFEQYFGKERYSGFDWYGGSPDNNGNSYQLFSAEGLNFVIIHLECNAPDEALHWATGVLEAHRNRRAIIATHMWAGPLTMPTTAGGWASDPKGRMQWKKCHGDRGNTPQQIYDKLVARHANVFMVLAGDQSRTQSLTLTSTGLNGNTIHELMCDIREGYIRLLRFLPAEGRIEVMTYSPVLQQLCPGTRIVPEPGKHQFNLKF